jgi:DNA-directed RNA polymerase subunit M/transcription elongation factor TFIIS
MQPLPVVRVPGLPAEAKRFRQDRLRVALHLRRRENEQALYRKSAGAPNVYLELCTSFLFRGDLEEEEETAGSARYKEEDASAMFEQVRVRVKDKRNALGRCGKCKGVNVKSVARQIRSSDEGMSVFYTCLDCGNEWMQR